MNNLIEQVVSVIYFLNIVFILSRPLEGIIIISIYSVLLQHFVSRYFMEILISSIFI